MFAKRAIIVVLVVCCLRN